MSDHFLICLAKNTTSVAPHEHCTSFIRGLRESDGSKNAWPVNRFNADKTRPRLPTLLGHDSILQRPLLSTSTGKADTMALDYRYLLEAYGREIGSVATIAFFCILYFVSAGKTSLLGLVWRSLADPFG